MNIKISTKMFLLQKNKIKKERKIPPLKKNNYLW